LNRIRIYTSTIKRRVSFVKVILADPRERIKGAMWGTNCVQSSVSQKLAYPIQLSSALAVTFNVNPPTRIRQ